MRKFATPMICYSPDGPSSGAASTSTPSDSGGGSTSSSGAPSGGAAPAAPTSAPASTPSATPGSTPSSPMTPGAAPTEPQAAPALVGDNFFDFSQLEFGGDDDEGDQLSPQPGPAPGTAQPQTPVQPQPQTPQAPPAEAAPGAAAPQPPTPGQPGPQEAPTSAPSPAEPAQIAQALMSDFTAISDHLATTADFQLSPADIEGLETDVAGTISKVAARTFVRAQAAAINQMARIVPAMVQKILETTKRNDERVGKFYERWPDLKRGQHHETVMRFAKTYRQMNPQSTFDQMTEDVGPMVMAALKIAPGQVQPQTNGHQPPNPMAPTGARRPQASPFVPAHGGGSGGPPQPASADPWAGLAGGGEDDE